MFGFNRTIKIKKNRQETTKASSERFAEYVFNADRMVSGQTGRIDNIFVIAQNLIDRERRRAFEDPVNILGI